MPIHREQLPIPPEYKNNEMFLDATEQMRNVIKVWTHQIEGFKLTKQYLSQNHGKIYDWIQSYEYKPGKKYAPNTIKEHTRVLAVLMEDLGYIDTAKKYYGFKDKLKAMIDQQAGEGNFISESRRQNFVLFSEFSRLREEYKKLWEANPTNNKLHIIYLMLAISTLQPPLRGDYADMNIWKTKRKVPSNDENYIFQKKGDDIWWVRINHDKMTERQKRKAEKKDKEYIPTEIPLSDPLWKKVSGSDESLDDVIKKSLEKLPRDYVVFAPTNEDKPIPESTLRKYMKEALNGKNFSFDVVRSSYVNHYMNMKPKLTPNEQDKIATAMRHSFLSARKEYAKVRDYDALIPAEEIPLIDIPVPPEPIPAKERPVKPRYNAREWSKKYRESEKGQIAIAKAKKKYAEKEQNKYNHLRAKIIQYNNMYQDANPSKKSIEKYHLKKVNGIWQ